MASCQAKSKPRAAGTRGAVPIAGWLAPLEALRSGTIVASPRRPRAAGVASSRAVDQYHGTKARGIGFQPVKLQDEKDGYHLHHRTKRHEEEDRLEANPTGGTTEHAETTER